MKKSEFQKLVKEEFKKGILSEVRRIRNDTFDNKEITAFVIASAEAPLIEDINDAFHSWWVIYNAILRNRDVLKYDERSLGAKCNKVNSLFNNLREAVIDLSTTLRQVEGEQMQTQLPSTLPDTSANVGPF